jgi:hypothetical protein
MRQKLNRLGAVKCKFSDAKTANEAVETKKPDGAIQQTGTVYSLTQRSLESNLSQKY